MRKFILFLVLVILTNLTNATNYYVAPNGADTNPGTIGSPFKTLTKASTVLAAKPGKGAGDTVFVRNGTYNGWPNTPTNGYAYMLLNNLKGTALNPCVFINYPGEKPIFDFTGVVITSTRPSPTGISIFNSDYLLFKGMRFTGLKQITDGSGVSRGLELNNCNWCTIEQIEIDHFQGTAFFGSNAVFDCTFKNCDAHHNDDRLSADGSGVPGSDAWDNADGFGFTGAGNTSDRITFDGCRAWLNCDDGWDNFGTNGKRTWKNCWAFWNGYYQDPGMPTKQPAGNGQGFKLGPCGTDLTGTDDLRVLQKCVAFENRAHGFDQNGEVTTRMKLLNCTSYGNIGYGFQFQYYPVSPGLILHTFKNNASLGNGSGPINLASSAPTNISNNSWNSGVTLTNADFVSISSLGADGPRKADGSLPDLNFLKLVQSSDLIDKGIDVGLSFSGSSPDIGANEYQASASNILPIVNAGIDKTIKLPVNSVSVTGTASDADGTVSAYSWNKISGPSTFTISTPTTASTNLTNLVQGTYQFELKVTDNSGGTAADTVQIIVQAANTPPTVNAGIDKTITLPTNNITLTGTVSDADGTITSVLWTRISGPVAGALGTPNSITTSLTGLIQGTYLYEFRATDNDGAIKRDTMQLTVNAAPNQLPIANAGIDKSITLPTDSIIVTGTGSDIDGTVSSYLWTKISGTGGLINSPNTASTKLYNLSAGIYSFELKVTDNNGGIAKDTMVVTVNQNPVTNQAPVVEVGAMQVLKWTKRGITVSTTISGTATDADGTIQSKTWTFVSGPSGSTIISPTQLSTVITFTKIGQYVFRLTAIDNQGSSSFADITIIIKSRDWIIKKQDLILN